MSCMPAPGVGLLSKAMDATLEIQKMCDKVKADVEKRAGKKYDVYTAKKYKTLICIKGEIYFIKVYVGELDYIDITLYVQNGKISLEDNPHQQD